MTSPPASPSLAALALTGTPAAVSGQVVSIQYLRAVAAMMVVAVHVEGQLRRLGYTGAWPEWMTSGVDIFFVISGFVMWITARSRHTGTAKFYWHRITRIVPLYWVLTSFIVAMMLALPSLVQSGRFEIDHVIMSYLFLPATQPITGLTQPVLESGWTLNYEMYFYAVFGALLFLSDRRLLLAIVIWLGASVTMGLIGPADNLFVQFYGSSIILDFGFGLALGACFVRGWVLARPLALVALGLGFLKLALPDVLMGPHWLAIGMPAFAVVAGAVAIERHYGITRIWPLLLLGDASYSLYLSHGMVLSASVQVTKKLGLGVYSGIIPGFFFGACLAAIAAAVLIHVAVEKPLIRYFSKKRRPVILALEPASASAPPGNGRFHPRIDVTAYSITSTARHTATTPIAAIHLSSRRSSTVSTVTSDPSCIDPSHR